jgi:hypothetical protein
VYIVLTGRRSLAHRVLGAGLLVLAFAGTIGPWAVRNTLLQKTFVTIDTMGGRNFMMGNYQYTPLYRGWDAIALEGEKAWHREVFAAFPTDVRATQGQVDKMAFTKGLEFIREHPGLTALRDVVKFFDFWGLERELLAGETRGIFGPIPQSVIVISGLAIQVSYVAALFLSIFGILFNPPADRRMHWLFLCIIAFICGLHTITFGHSRYHLPLIPLILLYAASAWTSRRTIWKQRWGGRFGLAVSLCLVFVLGWCWNVVAGDWALVLGVLAK